jgi:hypothetical protein
MQGERHAKRQSRAGESHHKECHLKAVCVQEKVQKKLLKKAKQAEKVERRTQTPDEPVRKNAEQLTREEPEEVRDRYL